MNVFGLRVGGMIRRDLAAYSISVPLLAYHNPAALCWLWFLQWHRSRPGSGGRHALFKVTHLPGHQAKTYVDLLGLGSLLFCYQAEGRVRSAPRVLAAVALLLAVVFATSPALATASMYAIGGFTAAAVSATPALAQAPAGAIDVGGIFGVWKPYVVEIVQIAAFAIVGLLAELARRKFNLSIEESHRNALQTAITNAAGLALNKLGNSLQGKKVEIGSPIIAEAVNYVAKSAPDAMAKFGLSPEDLREKVVAKIPQVANTTAPPAPAAG
jgi:hypothetical protein